MSKSNAMNVSVIGGALNDLHVKRDSDDDDTSNRTPFLSNEHMETGIGSLQERVKSSESLRHSNEFEEPLRKHSTQIDPEEAAKWLNPFHAVNLAIFASYLSVGFGMYFIQTPV